MQDDVNQAEPVQPAEEQTGQSADPVIKNIDDLEVVIGFELGRKIIGLKELSSMTAGTVFPLEVELTAPVTLTVNGQAVGRGRLVDMDGTIGVQVVKTAGGK